MAYLPCSRILEFTKGQSIYNGQHPLTSLNLIIDGKVKVARTSKDGRQIVVHIYKKDEFFIETLYRSAPQAAT